MVNIKNINKKFLQFSSLLLVASLLAGIMPSVPVQAAFPGKNGKIAFASRRDNNNDIYVMNADGSAPTRLTTNPATDWAPAWSPDGSRITFYSTRDGNQEIYVMNADGTGQINLTNNAGNDYFASWSPDGAKITFTSNRDGNQEIYTMNPDGSGLTRITNNAANDTLPNWSPDGNKIAFTTNRDGNNEIYTMNPDGSGVIRLTTTTTSDGFPSWSPDGNKIAFTTNRDGNNEIYTMNPDGSGLTRITNNAANDLMPRWSPDGTKFTFISNRDGNQEVYVMNADGTGQVNISNNAAYDEFPDWQPQIGTTITDPADPNRIITTIAASESYPVLDYTVDPNQTLILDGRLCDVTVASGGVLMGTGTACTITVNPGGTIAPGRSPGCLTSGNLSLSGTYTAEIGGTTACTQYDQLQVTGTVTVGGSLSLSLVNGFTPKAGDSFTIITNDGTDPVSGTFAGLAEGSTVTIGSTVFKISYIGGTGNDVVLTAQAATATPTATPTAPNTGTGQTPIAPSVLLLIAGMVISLTGLRAYTKRRGYKISSRA